MSDLRNLKEPEVLIKCAISHATLWRMVKAEKFPAPRKLSSKAVAWLSTEVDEWILNRPRVRTCKPDSSVL